MVGRPIRRSRIAHRHAAPGRDSSAADVPGNTRARDRLALLEAVIAPFRTADAVGVLMVAVFAAGADLCPSFRMSVPSAFQQLPPGSPASLSCAWRFAAGMNIANHQVNFGAERSTVLDYFRGEILPFFKDRPSK